MGTEIVAKIGGIVCAALSQNVLSVEPVIIVKHRELITFIILMNSLTLSAERVLAIVNIIQVIGHNILFSIVPSRLEGMAAFT